MARIKRGLEYFPMSTGFINDRIVRRIMKREGDSAFAVLVETLSYIYSGHGYYVSADELFYDDLSTNLYDSSSEDIKQIITLAAEYGLFDSELYKRHNILTSADIQRQYLFITKRRNCSQIEPEYCVLDEEELASLRTGKSGRDHIPTSQEKEEERNKATIKEDNVTFDSDNATFGTQKKRNQNKRNEKIENNLPNPPQRGDGGGTIPRKGKEMSQEDINALQVPPDGTARNLQGLKESLQAYNIPPPEQYAIILKSNYGAIGDLVWKGIGSIRGSNGKIKLPGHYLLSVMNK